MDNANEYDAIFIGDSRSLYAMHPNIMEPYWGLKSLNVAHWAHWLLTQHAQIADMIDDIPEGTVVVWSLSYANFSRQPVNPVYPVGWSRLYEYAGAGYDLGELLSAQISFSPPTSLLGRRTIVYEKFKTLSQKPLFNVSSSIGSANKSKIDEQQENARNDDLSRFQAPDVAYVRPWYDQSGALVSVEQYKTSGAYLRIELVPEYYREKQNEHIKDGATKFEGLSIDPEALSLFTDALDMMMAKDLKVIINELDEAPYIYASYEEQEKYLEAIRSEIRPIVEGYGFSYVTFNPRAMTNEDYFDYNHLNSQGVKKYLALLGPKLKKALNVNSGRASDHEL